MACMRAVNTNAHAVDLTYNHVVVMHGCTKALASPDRL